MDNYLPGMHRARKPFSKLVVMKVHFIAIGGAAMHNLAIALKKSGYEVTGSDDEIFEPSRSRLEQHGLLPADYGWRPERIGKDIGMVILGMHARKDNEELKKALELGIRVVSYPEFLYRESLNKKRIVIAGSHGKTTTTSLILHVLRSAGLDFDYMAGAAVPGFDEMVKLSDAPFIVLEGDEYFSSPIDMKAKFLWYRPHIAVITGIAWDHVNVYPTRESYSAAFAEFIESMEEGGTLFYYGGDAVLKSLARKSKKKVKMSAYEGLRGSLTGDGSMIDFEGAKYHVPVFGNHNLQNMSAAWLVCRELGISAPDFFKAAAGFRGAARRLELLAEGNGKKVYLDFAHSPSKLKATVAACREQFPGKRLLSVMEWHTFSSLNRNFLDEYRGCFDASDEAAVYFSPEVMVHKKLQPFTKEEVLKACNREDLAVMTDAGELASYILSRAAACEIILLMTSGNFGGTDIKALALAAVGR